WEQPASNASPTSVATAAVHHFIPCVSIACLRGSSCPNAPCWRAEWRPPCLVSSTAHRAAVKRPPSPGFPGSLRNPHEYYRFSPSERSPYSGLAKIHGKWAKNAAFLQFVVAENPRFGDKDHRTRGITSSRRACG